MVNSDYKGCCGSCELFQEAAEASLADEDHCLYRIDCRGSVVKVTGTYMHAANYNQSGIDCALRKDGKRDLIGPFDKMPCGNHNI